MVVVGGGPAGMAAAIAAARNGAKVTLLERYNHLGGLASGGMVLVLDDMWDAHNHEISVRGICMTMIERLARLKLATFPARARVGRSSATATVAGRAGAPSTSTATPSRTRCASRPRSIPTAGSASRSNGLREMGIELRLHSWFSRAVVEDGAIKGVVCETKAGREAILGDVVIDATGDLDVAASAGAPHIKGSYIMTTVFRLGGVDTDAAERFEYARARRRSPRSTRKRRSASAARGSTGGSRRRCRAWCGATARTWRGSTA